MIVKKFEELKKAKQRGQQDGCSDISGSQYLADGEIVPTEDLPGWSDIMMQEENLSRVNTWEWAFKQSSVIEYIDRNKKEIYLDVSKEKHHVYNQMKLNDRDTKL